MSEQEGHSVKVEPRGNDVYVITQTVEVVYSRGDNISIKIGEMVIAPHPYDFHKMMRWCESQIQRQTEPTP